MTLQTIANFLQFLFLWVINALGDFINFFSEQAYTVPPWLFDIWSTLTKVGLGAIVLAVSVSAFLIAAHLNGEANARIVVANTVKVVVLMALSWTLTWAAITQVQILENVIYDIAPAARDIKNFTTVIKITNVTKLRPAGDGIIAKDSKAMTYNDVTILARTVISDVVIFLMIVPMAIVLAAWLVRTVIIYIALPLSGIAMLGLFHPSWKSKMFDEWLTRFLTVLKMPLVLAAYFVLAMIIF